MTPIFLDVVVCICVTVGQDDYEKADILLHTAVEFLVDSIFVPFINVRNFKSRCQERNALFSPVDCDGVNLFVFLVIKFDILGPTIRTCKPKDGPKRPHLVAFVVFQVVEFNSQTLNGSLKPLKILWRGTPIRGDEHREKVLDRSGFVESATISVTVDQCAARGSSNTGEEASDALQITRGIPGTL